MDENNTINDPEEQPTKANPFKNWRFYVAYFITILILVGLSGLLSGGDEYWLIGVLLLCIPYMIVGLIIWGIIRKRSHAIALGVAFGSATPFTVLFIVTGGCGFFML